MLTHIHIRHLAVIDELAVEFGPGMTVITGETGAGKSILIDALGLCLGDRAEANLVRHGADQADITALFDIAEAAPIQQWLAENDFLIEPELSLRRTINKEGRSRAYINGSLTTAQKCSEIGSFLVDIHGQHEHQSLMNRQQHRYILDQTLNDARLVDHVRLAAKNVRKYQQELDTLTAGLDSNESKKDFLRYQINELSDVVVTPTELQSIEQELELLSQGEALLEALTGASQLCDEHTSGLRQASKLLEIGLRSELTSGPYELIESALIQINEAVSDLEKLSTRVDLNPERLTAVSAQLDTLYDMARKHKVRPENLSERLETLQADLDHLLDTDQTVTQLQTLIQQSRLDYAEKAHRLSIARATAASELQQAIQAQLGELDMGQCRFEIQLRTKETNTPSEVGNEDVEFMIATQAKGEPQGLAKIASGGELSRISLAIQVVTAQQSITPCLIFDEVDVGIGGATAEVVGQRLKQLTAHSQVLCVTHLAQVASQGHTHLKISKHSNSDMTATQIHSLDTEARIQELGRMIGGIQMTDQTLAYAAEMLHNAH